jgi:hypothetical protein
MYLSTIVSCLTLSYFIEWHVPSQKSERSCTWVLWVMFLPLSTIFLLGLGIVQTVWYCFLHFITVSLKYAITLLFYLLLCASIKLVLFVQWQICRTMKCKFLKFVHCRSLCRIVIRLLHLDCVQRGMTLNTKQQMVQGLHMMGLESLSYTDTKDIHTG